MADALTYWRKTSRENARCLRLGVGDTHACANHRGDFVTWIRADLAATTSDMDRTSFALAIVTDIPDLAAQKILRWFARDTRVAEDVIDRPRILNLDVDLLIAEYPAHAAAIGKLFDPTFTLPVAAIPSLTWTKFRNCVWDKLNVRVVPEAQWDEDPDG